MSRRRKCRECGRLMSSHRSAPVCPRCVAERKDRIHNDHTERICWCGAGPKASTWEDGAMEYRSAWDDEQEKHGREDKG